MKLHTPILIAAALVIFGCADQPRAADPDRRAEVAEVGATVMPFDLDATTHIFEKTSDGGLQQVISDEADPEQIRLIREHLQEISARFAKGDFHDPATIHGEAMPGLHELVMGYERLTIVYGEIEGGAEIRYTSADADLVGALHKWFDAQVSDHGEHAQHHR